MLLQLYRKKSSLDRPSSISQYKHLKHLGTGASGVVYAIDRHRVVKQYFQPDDTERRAYERIGRHPNIVNYLGTLDDGSLIVERGSLLRSIRHQDQISFRTKVSWLRDAAKAINYIHKRRIVHADIGCHNVVLVGSRLKLIDFEGCSIDGDSATSAYEWFSYRKMNPPVSQQSDIFAYGCMVFEIVTGKVPYQEYEQLPDRDRVIGQLYEKDLYPDTSGLPFGTLMKDCWSGGFRSMNEVIDELDREAGSCVTKIKTMLSTGFLSAIIHPLRCF